MALETMYPAVTNSPIATLTAGIAIDATTLPVSNVEYFADATVGEPGIMVLKLTESSEAVTYTGKSATSGAGNLTGCTRGADTTTIGGVIQGSASAWDSGTECAAMFTAKQAEAFKANIETLDSDLSSHTGDTNNPHSVDKTDVGLSSVTNDSQLKRADGDINSFTEKSTPVDADVLLLEDSAASYAKKKVLLSSLPSGDTVWNDILSSITTTPASTSTITTTADLTGTVKVGYPLRYTISSVIYYGIVTAITSSLITVAGASLGGTITAINYGDPARVHRESFIINGYYGDVSNTAVITSDLFVATGYPWILADAYVVQALYVAKGIDTGATAEKINITIGGYDLLSADVSVSVALQESVININTANYHIERKDVIEVDVTKGTNGNGHDLSVYLVVVFP